MPGSTDLIVKKLKRHCIQWSKVTGCQLDRVGSLTFDLRYPACNTYQFEQELVLLCFDADEDMKCYRFDTINQNNAELIKY